MTDNLPALPATGAICPVDIHEPHSDFVLRRSMSGAYRDGTGPLQLINPLSSDARHTLANRRADLVKALGRCDKIEAAKAIGAVLACYPAYHRDADTKALKQVIAKYVTELHDLPTWAIQQACDKIRHGTAPDVSRDFPPSTIQVRALAEFQLVPIKTELNQIGAVMSGVEAPPQLDVETRKAMGAKLKAMADDMRAKRVDDSEDRRAKVARKMASDTERLQRAEWGREEPLEAAPGLMISRPLARKMVRQ